MPFGIACRTAGSIGTGASGVRGWSATLGLFLLVLLLPGLAAADNEGRFDIISANSRLQDDVWLVDARLELHLSDEAVEALENGVPLRIQVQYEIIRKRSFWFDQVEPGPAQSFELQYLTLSQRYVVSDLNNDSQRSFASLLAALRGFSAIRDFPLIENAKLDPESRYRIAMRVVLDQENLPGPLQMLAFWRGDFSLESEWYKWTQK